MKKIKVTFYFEDHEEISIIGSYSEAKDLISAMTTVNNGLFNYVTFVNENNSTSVNINKVCYFKTEELEVDINELH